MLSVVFTIIAVACGLWASSRRAKKCRLRLPPGPPGQVLIGNALQVKPSHTWLYYADVAKQYGTLDAKEISKTRMLADSEIINV